jgi:hypothetical protein
VDRTGAVPSPPEWVDGDRLLVEDPNDGVGVED